MAYTHTFIYAEETRNEAQPQGQKMTVVNPMLIFSPKYLPGQFSFSVAIGMLEVDLTKTHVFRYNLTGPNVEIGLIVDTGDVLIPSQENPRKLPIEMQGLFMGFDLRNVDLALEGKYISEVFLDGESIGTYPIYAKGMNTDEQKPAIGLTVSK